MSRGCTDLLVAEHRLILRAVFVVKAMAGQAAEGRMPDPLDVDNIREFFRRFADEHHQGKEEAILFPALRAGAARSDCDLAQMMHEHEQERGLVEELEGALRTRDSADFAVSGMRLADVLGNHIYKEDNILFEKIENAIDPETDTRLVEALNYFDRAMNSGLKRELAHVVTELEWKYLGKAA